MQILVISHLSFGPKMSLNEFTDLDEIAYIQRCEDIFLNLLEQSHNEQASSLS